MAWWKRGAWPSAAAMAVWMHADLGAGQVDQGVARGVQPGDGGAGGHGCPAADQIGDRLQHLREMLPCAVRVTAVAHPLHGRVLDAVSFLHRRGVLHLVVKLPDSSPGTIPVSATDVFGQRVWPTPVARRPGSDLRKLFGNGPPDLRILVGASYASLVKSAAGCVVP